MQVHEFVQHGFNIVNNWQQDHTLTLNADKTKYLIYTMRKLQSALTSHHIYAHQCNRVINNDMCTCPTILVANCLVILDETLSSSKHIEVHVFTSRFFMYLNLHHYVFFHSTMLHFTSHIFEIV